MSNATQSSLLNSPKSANNLDLSGEILLPAAMPIMVDKGTSGPNPTPEQGPSVSRIESQMIRLRKARQRKEQDVVKYVPRTTEMD